MMPERATYLLHIYGSRAVSGWQGAARLDALVGGERRRFTDPEALLAYLRTTICTAAWPPVLLELPPGAIDPATTAEETGTHRGGEEEHADEEGSRRNGAPPTSAWDAAS